MADSGPWDGSDQHHIPQSSGRSSRSLRVSHLGNRTARRNIALRRSRMDDDVEEKVNDLTSSLRATSEVLSTADRMLDHYRCINEDQDEEIRRLRSELDRSTELMRQRRIQQRNRTRSQVRFADETSPEPEDDLRVSIRDLESGQRKLAGEISRDREERTRIDGDNRRSVRRLEESFQRVEDDLRDSLSERERMRKDREEDDVISRRQAEAMLKKSIDAEREVLSESVKLALEKEREIKELRDQLRESRGHSHDQELESKVRRIYDQERSAAKEKKERGKLIEELKSVKNLMNETASEKKMKERLKRIKSDEDLLERTERETRLLRSLQSTEDRLDDSERERRKLEQDLEAAVKRMEWTEGARNSALKQIDELNRELKASSDENTSLALSVRDFKAKLAESEVLRERLTSRVDSLCKKYEHEQRERETLQQQVDRLNDKLRDKKRELDEKAKYASDQERIAKENEEKKEELKNRAVETIKEYKIKCKKYEKDLERHKNETDDAKEDLRRVRRNTNEGSAKALALEKELREVLTERDRIKEELGKRLKEADDELRSVKKRLNSVLDENLNNEEKLSLLNDENKKLMERSQKMERRFEEELSRLKQECIELKDGIRDILGKKSRLEVKLKEEQSLREELANCLDDAKEEQAKAKEEVASLYRQLQREREDCNMSVRDTRDKMQKMREQSAQEIQEIERRLEEQSEELASKLADMKLQLADEKATVKALRKQQEKDGLDIESMRSQLTRVTEENLKLRNKHDEMRRETEAKDEIREEDKKRINELETEVRRCHCSLSRVTDEHKDTFKKADEDKAYYTSELDKQNAALKELSRQKKDLEDRDRENKETIAMLQKKIMKLNKHLDASAKALDASINALEEKQKVLDEFDSLRDDQDERDRMRNKYIRYQERVGSLKKELNDAKTHARELKKESKEADDLSTRLLESLSRLSSPGLSGVRANEISMSSPRLKRKEEFGSMDFLSPFSEGATHLNEDHNFKTPDKVSLSDLKHKNRSSRTSHQKSSHVKPEKD